MLRLSVLFAALLVFSCKEEKQPATFTSLSKESVFLKDSVSLFLSKVNEAQADSSKQVFLQGIDLLKNDKHAAKAISTFLRSLQIYPTANAYYELGNAYLQTGDWQRALTSFELAELLQYKPLGNVLFKQATCYAAMENSDKMYAYITYAVQNGFVDRKQLVSDVHFAKYLNDASLLTTYNEAMSGNGDPDEVLWQGYSNDFGQASFPLVVDTGTLRQLGEPRIISYDYEKFVPEMRDNKFSRDVGSEYFYVNKIMQNELSHVLLYGCRSYEEAGSPVHYILASFNSKGKLIDKMIVGGARKFDENYKLFKAGSKQQFTIEEYKNTYEKNTNENGFEDNKIISRSLVASKQFAIDANGRFVALQQS